MTKHISIAQAKATFSSCVKQAEAGEEVVITRHGRPVAAVVSMVELERLRQQNAGGKRGGLLSLVGLDPDGEFTRALENGVLQRGQPRSTPDFE
ncbi:MAG: type II toxin-antitoxin system Phd/YefM family antitoxin [Oligoflexia bacterium]|nr:type II toxin-antitoxin system Phd/YefM family antitoxin [Oligoflexia bacterium]